MSLDFANARLGQDSELYRVQGIEPLAAALRAMGRQARRRLWISSHVLNRQIYDNADFVDAVRRLATEHPQADIRILVRDLRSIVQDGRGLVRLAQRLPSIIAIRHLTDDDDQRSFLIADEAGSVLRARWFDLHEAQVSFADRAQVRRLSDDFVRNWETATVPSELRQLSL